MQFWPCHIKTPVSHVFFVFHFWTERKKSEIILFGLSAGAPGPKGFQGEIGAKG